ncbi:MAG TPA: barstar family protein [Burkholderiales bacterium]|nr:barstar family protein [Burkholderiales bacterium]
MAGSSKAFPSGVYLAPDDLTASRAAAGRAEIASRDINLERVASKREFLAACARALRFPKTFGGNWDALADCLKDLCADSFINCRNCASFAEAAPDDYATALEIFQDAASYWRARGSVFAVLVDAEAQGVRLARFPAPNGRI